MNLKRYKPIRILLVEDNLQDIEITRRAFTQGNDSNEIYLARDGQDALDYLYRRGKFFDKYTSPRPDLILLDLNLPKTSGLEVLEQIKKDDVLKLIPVIVLTVSEREADISKSYRLGANTYIQKPLVYRDFLNLVNSIREYWISTSKLPITTE